MEQIKLQDLKSKSPTELLALAEENDIENASTMRKQDMMFAILKELAEQGIFIIGEGADVVYTGTGEDFIRYDVFDDQVDILMDFQILLILKTILEVLKDMVNMHFNLLTLILMLIVMVDSLVMKTKMEILSEMTMMNT